MAEVSFVLKVADQPAPAELLEAVQSLEVEDHASQADMLRLRAGVGVAADGGRWNVLDSGLFTRLVNIKVATKAGSGPAQPVIDAYVIDLRAAFSAEPGRSTLDVVAMDATTLLQLEEKVRAWPDQADSQIARSIFSDHGLTADVTDTQPVRRASQHTTMQRGTDLQFLRRLAQRNGFETFVEVGADGRSVGHFHAPRLDEQPQAVLNVNMGSDTNVDAFAARHDLLSATTAKVTGLDTEQRKDQPADVQSSQQTALGGKPAGGGDRPRRVLLAGTGLSDAGELQMLAQAVVDRSAMALSAEGTVFGADFGQVLRAKRPVLVRGAGQEFSGTWYVERVLHEFGADGHVQRFTLKRNASGLTRQEQFQTNTAAAPQPAVRI